MYFSLSIEVMHIVVVSWMLASMPLKYHTTTSILVCIFQSCELAIAISGGTEIMCTISIACEDFEC